MECVSCAATYKFDLSGDLQPISSEGATNVPIKQIVELAPAATNSTSTSTTAFQSFLPPVQAKKVNETDPSAKLSQKLLAGWAMLARACGEVGCDGAVPLMRDLQGRVSIPNNRIDNLIILQIFLTQLLYT